MKNLRFVTKNNGDKYVLQGYVVGTWYLIPYVSDNLEYWEPHHAKQNTWIPIKDVVWNDYDITKEEYLEEKRISEISDREILAKYQSSF